MSYMIHQILVKVLTSSGILGSCSSVCGIYIWKPEWLQQRVSPAVIYAFLKTPDAQSTNSVDSLPEFYDSNFICKLKTNKIDDTCYVEKTSLNEVNKWTTLSHLYKPDSSIFLHRLKNEDFKNKDAIFKITVSDHFFDDILWTNNNILDLLLVNKDTKGTPTITQKSYATLEPILGVKNAKAYFNSTQYLMGLASFKKTYTFNDNKKISCAFYNDKKFEDYLECEVIKFSTEHKKVWSNSSLIWNQNLTEKVNQVEDGYNYLIKFKNSNNRITTEHPSNATLLLFEDSHNNQNWNEVGRFVNTMKVLPVPKTTTKNLIIF